MVYSAKEFLDLQKTGNAIAVNIKEFATKALSANVAELKLQIQKFVATEWGTLNLQHL